MLFDTDSPLRNSTCFVLQKEVHLVMADINKVLWSKQVGKQLDKLPEVIVRKFYAWVTSVQLSGLREVRRLPGFHDEPLKGQRAGQRSVRLNKAYRAIYIENNDGTLEFIEVIEVNKHEY